MMKCVALAVLVLAALIGRADAQVITGAGVVGCGAWVREDPEGATYPLRVVWATGYISGAVVHDENVVGNPLDGVDYDALDRWLANWCRTRPRRPFLDAVKAFIEAHNR